MVAHVYRKWCKKVPKEIPALYGQENISEAMRRRLNTVWELRSHRIYQFLGIPCKGRCANNEGAEERLSKRLADFHAYSGCGGLLQEVSNKFIIFIIHIFHYRKSMGEIIFLHHKI